MRGDLGAEGAFDSTAEAEDSSRRRFLELAAPAAAGGLAAFLAACGGSSGSKSSKSQETRGGQDLDIVNYALTLEYIESDFYDEVVRSGLFSGAEAALFKQIRVHEHDHVAALSALAKKLGGKPAERPQTRFPIGSRGGVLQLAATLENTGAAAYLGQADLIDSREVLAAALSIHTIEARHAAKLNRLAGRDFTPDGAFASPRAMGEVNDAVQRFIV